MIQSYWIPVYSMLLSNLVLSKMKFFVIWGSLWMFFVPGIRTSPVSDDRKKDLIWWTLELKGIHFSNSGLKSSYDVGSIFQGLLVFSYFLKPANSMESTLLRLWWLSVLLIGRKQSWTLMDYFIIMLHPFLADAIIK